MRGPLILSGRQGQRRRLPGPELFSFSGSSWGLGCKATLGATETPARLIPITWVCPTDRKPTWPGQRGPDPLSPQLRGGPGVSEGAPNASSFTALVPSRLTPQQPWPQACSAASQPCSCLRALAFPVLLRKLPPARLGTWLLPRLSSQLRCHPPGQPPRPLPGHPHHATSALRFSFLLRTLLISPLILFPYLSA